MSTLEVRHVSVHYPTASGVPVHALEDVSLSVQGTDFVVEETIESLLNLLEQSSLEEQDEILDRLSEKLSQWEADFLLLETHVEQHIPEELDSMDALALLFELADDVRHDFIPLVLLNRQSARQGQKVTGPSCLAIRPERIHEIVFASESGLCARIRGVHTVERDICHALSP